MVQFFICWGLEVKRTEGEKDRMNISVCMITKNESKNLEECLKRIVQFPVEVVVVDTGSTDQSVAIAKKYTSCVFDFPWCDDFSKARNYTASKASHDLIVGIDTDEFVDLWDFDAFEKAVSKNPYKIGKLCQKNRYVSNGVLLKSNDWVNRIYDRRFFRFDGVIHEQLIPINHNENGTYKVPLYVDHVGYLGDEKERDIKANRNINLLLTALEKNPKDTYLLYQIGKSYYYKSDYANAVEYLSKCFDYSLDRRLEYVLDLFVTLGYALINADCAAQALVLENVYEEFCWSANYLFVMGMIYMQNGRFGDAIVQLKKATTLSETNIDGVNSYLAYYNIGVIYECLEEKSQALQYYQKAGDYQPAKEGILRIKGLY